MLSFAYGFVEAAQQRAEEVGDDAAAAFQHPIYSSWTGLTGEPCRPEPERPAPCGAVPQYLCAKDLNRPVWRSVIRFSMSRRDAVVEMACLDPQVPNKENIACPDGRSGHLNFIKSTQNTGAQAVRRSFRLRSAIG